MTFTASVLPDSMFLYGEDLDKFIIDRLEKEIEDLNQKIHLSGKIL